ncbi:MAG: hypothetical protein MI861_07450 [Pirellulales bacterium]|nr:hypothetical protein [Pirellulales bacterium]
MCRKIILIVAAFCTLDAAHVMAQNGYRSPSCRRPGTSNLYYGAPNLYYGAPGYISPGFGYAGRYPIDGYGYVYDPYLRGRFKAPDLLDDPYFRYQHKFDSHFPGRYNRRPPLQLRGSNGLR